MYTEVNDGGASAGSLLRAWRAAASAKSGRPILQRDVAKALGRTDRWYRGLEGDTITRALTRKECDTLGTLFGLDQAQRHALFLASSGGAFCQIETNGPPQIGPELRLLLDQQPFPAYVIDAAWNVLAANETMSDLFPWTTEPDANLMRWLLLSPEGREQHLNWQADAAVCIRMLRAAAVAYPRDRNLQHLIGDTSQDPLVLELWTASAGDVAEHYDGHVLRMSLPRCAGQVTELITHVMQLSGLPGCRMTVLTWRATEEKDTRPAMAP